MNRQVENYVEQVMGYMDAGEGTKKRLSEDLRAHILDAAGEDATDRQVEAVIARMGEPKDLAVELTDMLYADKQSVVRELVETKAQLRARMAYEYKSKRTLFGLPLVHIHLSNGYRRGVGCVRITGFRPRPAVAKGILAIGDISIGLISIGGISLGGLCLGGFALGLLSFGGIGVGLLMGLGGMAVGSFALGGLAVGQIAFGGCALASQIAVGGYARATVAIGGEAVGLHTLSTGGNSLNASLITKEAARALIAQAYPTLWKPLANLLVWPFAP